MTLPEEESKHAVKVLRMKAGEELYLTDGQGTMCRCAILAPDARACSVEVIERHEAYGQRRHRLHIAVAPTKNTERIDWFVEKAVEIGIDEITPIICDHSERNVLKAERLEKKVISAMKQSLKAYKPIINEPIKMVDFIAQQNATEDNTCRMICYCDGDIRVLIENFRYFSGSGNVPFLRNYMDIQRYFEIKNGELKDFQNHQC